jgi:hypothetical protein
MAASPQDVQAKIDSAVVELEKATSTYASMVKKYGAVWASWPTTSHWFRGLSALADARAEVGNLVAPKLTADFKETQ